MRRAFGYLREAISEFYYDLLRMVLLNVFWFATAVPALWIALITAGALRTAGRGAWVQIAALLAPAFGLALAIAGPGTAAIYAATNRLANGELFEPAAFWPALRRFFWRGWGLAALDTAAGALLTLNIWFYWQLGRPGIGLLSLIFAYLLLIWLAVQSYLFAILVEMNQPLPLVLRNALFVAADNPALTLGLLLVNLLIMLLSIPLSALLIPGASLALLSNVHNKAVVSLVRSYRESGRMIGTPAGREP